MFILSYNLHFLCSLKYLMTEDKTDIKFMQQAIKLAKKGSMTTTPNPAVGCVLVKNNKVISTGFHLKSGDNHAEINALNEVQQLDAQNADCYVTMEPCAHSGKTPSCADALIKAKVKRVIIGQIDPNPLVKGKGIKLLKDNNIIVKTNILEKKCQEINKGFNKRMQSQKPYIRLKLASSLDGKTALSNGKSKWITSSDAREDVQNYRARSCAILTTSKTVIEDNSRLNVRSKKIAKDYLQKEIRQPIKIILDAKNLIYKDLNVFADQTPVWLIKNEKVKWKKSHNFPDFVKIFHLPTKQNQFDLTNLVNFLAKKELNNLWVEAGSTFAGAMLKAKLVDQWIIYMAPKLMGQDAMSLININKIMNMNDVVNFSFTKVQELGCDLKLILQEAN